MSKELPNLLPRDGIALYPGIIFSSHEAEDYLTTLLHSIPWQQDEVVMFGKRIVTARKTAWYGDAPYAYSYSGSTKTALPWTSELSEIKREVERHSGHRYNSCLLNLYHHGGEGMGWHSDDESTLVRDAAIASVSLGAERRFSFKHKSEPELKTSVMLESGSLLVMTGATQRHWLHSLTKSNKIAEPRINLTFRLMNADSAKP